MIYRRVQWELVPECSQVDYKKIKHGNSAFSVFEVGEPLKNAVEKKGFRRMHREHHRPNASGRSRCRGVDSSSGLPG